MGKLLAFGYPTTEDLYGDEYRRPMPDWMFYPLLIAFVLGVIAMIVFRHIDKKRWLARMKYQMEDCPEWANRLNFVQLDWVSKMTLLTPAERAMEIESSILPDIPLTKAQKLSLLPLVQDAIQEPYRFDI